MLLCEDWFDGRNDQRVTLADPASGGGCDAVTRQGRNENQGAESTLALLAVRQLARVVGGRPGRRMAPELDGVSR